MTAEEPAPSLAPAVAARPRALAALIGVYFLLMLPNLDNSYPYQGDETFYTISALNMIDRGDYLVPFYEGEHRFNKPILPYWVAAAGYRVFGVSMWSARVPILLLACLTLFTTHRLALYALGDPRKALLAAAMLAASPMFFSFSRVAMTEMVLTALTVPAVFLYARALAQPERAGRDAALGTAFIGLAFMAKGPVALLPFGAALIQGVRPAARRQGKRPLAALLNPLNLAVFALLTVPWYAYVGAIDPAAFAGDLATESRALRTSSLAGVAKRALSYAVALAIFTFPFLLAAAARVVGKRASWRPPGSYLVTCVLAHLLTFVLVVGTYKSRYLMPVLPLLCVLLAETLFPSRWKRWLATASVLLALQAAVYALFPLVSGEPLRDLTRRWKDGYSTAGTLGVALDPKRAGWCRLYAGDRGLAPAATAAFVIVEDVDLARYAGWETVATATRNTAPRISKGRLTFTRRAFHLLRRPPPLTS